MSRIRPEPEESGLNRLDSHARLSRDHQERAWAQAMRVGDNASFEALFREYHPRLCSFAYRFTGSRDIAEELVQETFLYLSQHRVTCDISGSIPRIPRVADRQ